MFKLRGTAEERLAAATAFKAAIERLPEEIEPLQSVEVGINVNATEEWDVVLTAILPTLEDVGVYARHPAHVAAAGILAGCKEARGCVDYEI